MDLQMKRHKWFPTDDGLDVCSVCAQPDLPEVGIFCPGPKPVIEPIPPGPYVEPRFDPKPATPEPPEWIIDPVPQALVPKSEKPAPENVRLVYVTLGRDGSYAQVQDKKGSWHEVTISEASELISGHQASCRGGGNDPCD